MKLLVDEMPYYKDDCLFTEQKWSDKEETWVSYCKLTSARCDLDEEQCSCLKVLKTEPSDSEKPNNSTISKMEQVDKDTNVRSKDEPTTQTETQNSNKNSNVILVYDGVSEAVRCAMCSNPNKSNRGCDGACSYDEKLYERIMKAITTNKVKDEPQTDIHGITDCDFCKHGSEEWDSEACDGCCNANNHFEPKDEPQTERSE